MSATDILSAQEIAALVGQGKADARQQVDYALARAKADMDLAPTDMKKLNAFVHVHRERAMAAAERVNQRVKAGELLPLAGVPLAVKDNLCVAGTEVTAASKILRGFVPPYTATAVQRLEAAGAVVIGSTNMDEFAMGSSNETSAYGPVRNPVNPSFIPGGSSGGSAAAVAAGIVPLALGSDTGGSIRQPAALCGCVGLKPTYGNVSRYGLIAFGSSLDQIGPLSANVADAALCLQAMAGADSLDSTCSTAKRPDAFAALNLKDPKTGLKGLKIGYVGAHQGLMQRDMRDRFEEALKALEAAGAKRVEVAMPHEGLGIAVYYVIATGEASSNLSRFDGIRFGHRTDGAESLGELYSRSRAEGFGTEVKRRIMLGTYVLSSGYYDAYYRKAQQVRRLICDDYAKVFAKCDVLLGPTSPTTAFRLGEKMTDPMQMYLSDVFTISANLAGVPAISVPFGKIPPPSNNPGELMPIGLQLQGPQWSEPTLLRAAAGLEALVSA